MATPPTDDLQSGGLQGVDTDGEGAGPEPVTDEPIAGSTDVPVAVRAPKPKVKRDPVVQALWMAIAVVVILALVTVLYALLTGVFGTGAPRTMREYKIESSQARLATGSKELKDWNEYILALTADGQYRLAQQTIDKGRKVLKKQEVSADMVYMQANLDLAQGKLDSALKNADVGLKTIKTTYDKDYAEWKSSGEPNESSFGISANYWELLLIKADVLEAKKDWKGALAAYDEFLARNATAATAFVQRGDVKATMNDTKGAEADYRNALKFIPDNAEALAGLKRIGAVK